MAMTHPGRLVEPERLPIGGPRTGLEQTPARSQLDRRIAAAQTTEVDYAREPAPLDQHVAGQEITEQPYRRSGPLTSPRDVQIAARHADPKTTMRYDRARKNRFR
ncbi:hypothetical protein GCM10012284_63270 [Mangrovihabitans endophyticus]|uniref:Uncharacterized protein n=1 Tax=Mangrovihabitans endophyticus TaxID=1751298 RepID=A0A8J3C637_9ACTN|nr:hypothetical protein GCM10012284_63270 [Mangrovihabitans endophyticus]